MKTHLPHTSNNKSWMRAHTKSQKHTHTHTSSCIGSWQGNGGKKGKEVDGDDFESRGRHENCAGGRCCHRDIVPPTLGSRSIIGVSGGGREQHRLHACVRCDRQAIKTTLQKIIILLRNRVSHEHQLKTQNGIQVVECLHLFLYSFAELCLAFISWPKMVFFAHILLCENGRLCLLCASISRRTENMMLFHQETSVISVVVDVVSAINEKRK